MSTETAAAVGVAPGRRWRDADASSPGGTHPPPQQRTTATTVTFTRSSLPYNSGGLGRQFGRRKLTRLSLLVRRPRATLRRLTTVGQALAATDTVVIEGERAA